MKARGIKRVLKQVRTVVEAEIASKRTGSRWSGAMASEGYAGGYRDAIDDVLLALEGVEPSRSHYWLTPTPSEERR